ncbi:TetR/AcrR family transcriptional regulator [Pendulispora albinea]|uniref:TetR/AcrR family transcriptional regulator n=1 Tax=Pendulispora albinea TaxID=2741071 RepID=A0ABZ2M159_9BACT
MSDETGARIRKKALALFRKRGFERTTMRDIARAAKVSLGAAYYYFPSKDALVLSYYEDMQLAHDKAARAAFRGANGLEERVRGVLHSKLDVVADDRHLLGAIFRTAVDPESALSAFASSTGGVRQQSVAIFDEAVGDEPMPEDIRALLPKAMWLLHVGMLLYFAHDQSPGQIRTRHLVDDAARVIVPLIAMASLPMLAPMREELVRLVARAFEPQVPSPSTPPAPGESS